MRNPGRQTSIYLPGDLADEIQELRALGIPFNISEIAQKAIKETIEATRSQLAFQRAVAKARENPGTPVPVSTDPNDGIILFQPGGN